MDPRAASYKAMEEVASPVVAIALILAAVFVPTAFIPGITGRLYQQFSITIAISVLFSAFNALTLSPALCAMLLKPKSDEKKKKSLLARFFDWFNRVFGRVTDGYVSTSGWLVRKSGVAIVLLLCIAGGALYLGIRLPGGFLPTEDQGYAFVALQLPQGASLKRTSEASKTVENQLLKIPGVDSVTSVIGFTRCEFSTNCHSIACASSSSTIRAGSEKTSASCEARKRLAPATISKPFWLGRTVMG